MRHPPLFLALALPVLTLAEGVKPRSAPLDYAAHAEDKGVRIAAEVLSRDQVRNLFSTDLSDYVVVEVAVWPVQGKQLDISAVDFSLRLDGRSPIRPAGSKTIARINQRRGEARRDDIVLYPSIGVTTGTWGTGTMIGVGVGTGGGAPGPASTDQDRRTMESELADQGLPDAVIDKPTAGYLYFPVGSKHKRTGTGELVYEGDSIRTELKLPISGK